MGKVSSGRILNPEKDPHIYEAAATPAEKYFNYDGLALPTGSDATQWQQEVTISLPPPFAA